MAFGDSSTANPINPQGSAGGGNVFEIGSLFGASENSGESEGDNGASVSSADTAAMGGSAAGESSASLPTSVSDFWSSYGLWILLGGGLLLVVFAFKKFHRKK